MKKQKTAKKPSKSDLITLDTEQAFTDKATETLLRQRAIRYFHADTLDTEIDDILRQLTEARRQKTVLEAKIAGIVRVLAKR